MGDHDSSYAIGVPALDEGGFVLNVRDLNGTSHGASEEIQIVQGSAPVLSVDITAAP